MSPRTLLTLTTHQFSNFTTICFLFWPFRPHFSIVFWLQNIHFLFRVSKRFKQVLTQVSDVFVSTFIIEICHFILYCSFFRSFAIFSSVKPIFNHIILRYFCFCEQYLLFLGPVALGVFLKCFVFNLPTPSICIGQLYPFLVVN